MSPMDLDLDYERFLDCVHCGLCTSACPTYAELGTETDSPRGRIHLLRAVQDGRLDLSDRVLAHLDLCLDCRACETACPSGIHYGQIIEAFRDRVEPTRARTLLDRLFRNWVLLWLFPSAWRTRLAMIPARVCQRLGIDGWLASLMPRPFPLMQAMLPRLHPRGERLAAFNPAYGRRRARVAFFTGCVTDAMYFATNMATVRVLQANGCDVHVPRGQVCCGAIHYHSGERATARRLANTNADVFLAEPYDAVVTNCAGCGSTLKHYAELVADERGQTLVSRVRDVSEFLAELGPIRPRGSIPIRATYHPPCHLVHAQQVRDAPTQLLSMIPGLELVPLPEAEICCGAAGSYMLTQPDMSERLGRRKLANILSTGAQAVFTGNVGCILQIQKMARLQHADLWVAHPIDVLYQSYWRRGLAGPSELRRRCRAAWG